MNNGAIESIPASVRVSAPTAQAYSVALTAMQESFDVVPMTEHLQQVVAYSLQEDAEVEGATVLAAGEMLAVACQLRVHYLNDASMALQRLHQIAVLCKNTEDDLHYLRQRVAVLNKLKQVLTVIDTCKN